MNEDNLYRVHRQTRRVQRAPIKSNSDLGPIVHEISGWLLGLAAPQFCGDFIQSVKPFLIRILAPFGFKQIELSMLHPNVLAWHSYDPELNIARGQNTRYYVRT
jgi:hypothetical protein